MSGEGKPAALDRPAARLAAVAVALAGIAFLAWLHRDDLFPPDPAAAAATSPQRAAFNACFEPRAAQFANSLERGELTEGQAALFRERARAFCADQAEKGRLSDPSGY